MKRLDNSLRIMKNTERSNMTLNTDGGGIVLCIVLCECSIKGGHMPVPEHIKEGIHHNNLDSKP